VVLTATDFCMDATNGAAAGVVLQYWTCYDNNPNQQWTTT
jgi:hypothetical protein